MKKLFVLAVSMVVFVVSSVLNVSAAETNVIWVDPEQDSSYKLVSEYGFFLQEEKVLHGRRYATLSHANGNEIDLIEGANYVIYFNGEITSQMWELYSTAEYSEKTGWNISYPLDLLACDLATKYPRSVREIGADYGFNFRTGHDRYGNYAVLEANDKKSIFFREGDSNIYLFKKLSPEYSKPHWEPYATNVTVSFEDEEVYAHSAWLSLLLLSYDE